MTLDLRLRPRLPPGGYTSSAGGTTLRVGGRDVSAYILDHSMTLKFNTFDVTLVDDGTLVPLIAPSINELVYLLEPAWDGKVVGIKQSDVKKGTARFFTITCTNAYLKYASPAPYGVSDNPNGSTTYGYADLSMSQALTSDGLETRGSFTTFQPGLWPAMTFTLTSVNFAKVAAQYSVSDVTVTWPKKGSPFYRVDFGDALVTLSAWVVGSAEDSILPITTTKITDGAVTTPKVAANAITASLIAAGAISADKLVAELILGTLIASGTSGRRWEADTAGIRLYDASDGLLVNIPTDGSPVYVAGQINASSLVVSGNAEFQGTGNQFSQLSSTTAQAGVQPPSAAPSLVAGWPTGVALAAPSLTSYDIAGGYYDSAGGANGATACWVALVLDNDSAKVKVYEWKVSTGVVDRITTVVPTLAFSGGRAYITRIGANWYIHASYSGSDSMLRVDRSTGTADLVGSGATYGAALTTDGSILYAYLIAGPTIQEISTTTLAITANHTVTGLGSATTQDTLLYADIGAGGRFWIGSAGSGRIYEVNSATYATVANTDFPSAKTLGNDYGFIWDGTQFQHAAWTTAGGTTPVSKYTSWTWTTASAIYWACYSWYDSAGTTHETSVGPRQSITMDRRKQLIVGNAAIPTGGADDPNQVRVYMLPNATDPGATAFKLQSTDALTTRTLLTYNAAGAADGGGTPFVGGIGAVLQSSGAGWKLRGNGSLNLGGASFPGSPVTNDAYYRTDLDLWFSYDGTRWLSMELYETDVTISPSFGAVWPFSATATSGMRAAVPELSGGSDLWLVNAFTTFFVNSGGTALGAAHKWVGVLSKADSANALTTLATVNIDSGASAAWRTNTAAIGALLGANFEFVVTWTKTGTPGTLVPHMVVTCRIVAT